VRIDGTHGVDPGNLPEGSASPSKPVKPADLSGAGRTADDLLELSSQQPYIRAAMESDEVNMQAVEEARKLLESGRLDTLEAARRAAESLTDRGI